MNAIGIAFVVLCCAAIIFLPRRFALLAVWGSVCYITQAEGVVVLGFHFFAHRIVLLAGLIRIVSRGELQSLKLNKIDWAFLAYVIVSCVAPGIRLGVWQEEIGGAYNMLLSYFLFRGLVTRWEDIHELLPQLAILIIPLAFFMVIEYTTGNNVFDVMGYRISGGWMRNEHYRCIGAFRGPHTAGIFGAALIPLLVYLLFVPGRRGTAIAGLFAASAITFTSNSSGPLMAFLSGLVGLAFWPLRKEMRRVRWGIVGALAGLALVMKAPLWFLLAKVSDITGGDGWYRSYLMQQCFNHISDWWLLGTENTSDWAPALMPWGGADLCNLYVSCAAGSGLGALILIILLLVRCFSFLGSAMKALRDRMPQAVGLLWSCGCVLFAHVCVLFSVTYWDQLFVVWWGFLAMISSATSAIRAQATLAETVEGAVEAPADELIA